MKLPNFRALRAKITTSADVNAQVQQHRTLLAEASASLAHLDGARHDVLLGDDVGAIQEHEAKSAEMRTTMDRLEARLAALADQAAEIAAREASADLDNRRASLESRAADGVAWLREVYPEIAHALIDGLTSLHDVERQIHAMNVELAEAGRDDAQQLAGVQARLAIFLGGGSPHAGSPLASGSATSLGGLVSLPELVGVNVRAPGWAPRQWS